MVKLAYSNGYSCGSGLISGESLRISVLMWLDAEKSSGPPLILNPVLAQDKERSNKRIDSALSHLKHLGLTDEKTSRLLEALKVKRP